MNYLNLREDLSYLDVPIKEKKRPSLKQPAVALSGQRFHGPILHLLLAIFLATKAVYRALEKGATFVLIRVQGAVETQSRTWHSTVGKWVGGC